MTIKLPLHLSSRSQYRDGEVSPISTLTAQPMIGTERLRTRFKNVPAVWSSTFDTVLQSNTDHDTTSAKNISVWADWLRQSGRAPSEPSETPRWRITPRPASIPPAELHIALRSPFRRFFSLCRSPILNKHSGVVANCDHTSEWVQCVHAYIRIHAIARIHEISQRASETKSWET
jgi:hypothetical protein